MINAINPYLYISPALDILIFPSEFKGSWGKFSIFQKQCFSLLANISAYDLWGNLLILVFETLKLGIQNSVLLQCISTKATEVSVSSLSDIVFWILTLKSSIFLHCTFKRIWNSLGNWFWTITQQQTIRYLQNLGFKGHRLWRPDE